MIKLFKHRNEEYIASPCRGTVVKLENVNDKIFAQKLLGDGFAIRPKDDMICAPCDGEITMLADTSHAFGIRTGFGAEILVHVGLDTVNLQGKGFRALAAPHQRVKTGAPILKLDMTFLKKQNLDLTVMIILLDNSEYRIDVQSNAEETQSSERIATITKS